MNSFLNKISLLMVVAFVGFASPGCNIDPIENPNAPTIGSVENGASLDDLRLLASGIESVMRFDMEYYYWTLSIVGREYYDLRGTDPRFTGELTGAKGARLDNNGFLTTRAFAQQYKAIRNCYILENATKNSKAGLTDAQKSGIYGYSKTMRALNLLMVLNRHREARLDVSDLNNLGAFVDHAAGLTAVTDLLNAADSDLAAAGTDLAIILSSGFKDYDSVAGFRKFNRALAARVAIYRGDKAAARTALNASFMDLTGNFNKGVYHIFGLSGNDEANPLFFAANQAYGVPANFATDADANDARVPGKTFVRDSAALDGYVCLIHPNTYKSNTDPVAIIRNEELVLIWAEAHIGTDNITSIAAINAVRQAAGLGLYSGATTDAAVLTELLKQRRYSLFGEGHRWIDLNRTGRLGDIAIDRAGDIIHAKFPRPLTEG
jgi:starch-binding outer membrane protein, SusD/RagB family